MSILQPVLRPVLQPLSLSLTRAGVPIWTPRRLFAAGEQGAWYDPSDLSTLFQDSAGATPVTAVGQPVGMLKDKSGRGNHATQATTTARPTLQQDSGGRYYLSFDGVDDLLLCASGAGSSALSAFQALRWAVLGASVFTFGNSQNSGGLGLFKSSGDGIAAEYGTGASRVGLASGTTAAAATPYVVGATTSGTAVKSFANLAAPASTGAVTNPAGPSSFVLGGTVGGSALLNGRIYGHIHVARVVSETERLKAIRYLAARSGVTL